MRKILFLPISARSHLRAFPQHFTAELPPHNLLRWVYLCLRWKFVNIFSFSTFSFVLSLSLYAFQSHPFRSFSLIWQTNNDVVAVGLLTEFWSGAARRRRRCVVNEEGALNDNDVDGPITVWFYLSPRTYSFFVVRASGRVCVRVLRINSVYYCVHLAASECVWVRVCVFVSDHPPHHIVLSSSSSPRPLSSVHMPPLPQHEWMSDWLCAACCVWQDKHIFRCSTNKHTHTQHNHINTINNFFYY